LDFGGVEMRKNIFKFWVGIFIIIGLNTNLNAFGMDDLKISTYGCSTQNEYTESVCKKDDECKAVLELCKFTLDELQKIGLDTNAKKYIITYGAKGVTGINKYLVKKGLLKKTNSNILNKVFQKYAKALKSANKVGKSIIPTEWGLFALDIGVDIYTDLILESKYFENQYKNNSILQKLGDKDTAKQVIKWWISILYTDIKWGIASASGHPIIGAREALVGNAEVLFDILKEDAKAAHELFNSKIDVAYSKEVSAILNLNFNYGKKYYQESNTVEKNKILTSFITECNKRKINGFLGFYSSITGALAVRNNSLRNVCHKYEKDIRETERTKIRILHNDIVNNDELMFEKHLEYFYPKYKYDYAWRMFKNPKKFNISTLSFYGDVYHDNVIKALKYGFVLDDFNLAYASDPYAEIKRYTAYNWAIKAQNKHHINETGLEYDFIKEDEYKYNKVFITRKEFAHFLNGLYELDKLYYQTDYVDGLKKSKLVRKNGWTDSALALNILGIVGGKPKNNNFRGNDKLSIYEAITMIVRTVDVYTSLNTGEEY
jgi:hypothetical protein